MRILAVALALALSTAACATERPSLALPQAPPPVLSRSTPEEQGISSTAILSFLQSADHDIDAIHSFMLVRHGHIVAQGFWSPYAPDVPHKMFSLSKSFTSTAVGLAIAAGKLSLDAPVLSFFPEAAPAQPSDNLKAMRVRDLLTMSTGQRADEVAKISSLENDHLTRAFLALPVDYKPGTLFVYNTAATYMLSAIVQKVTGMTTKDFLEPRLFEPLGIDHPAWDASSEGVTLGGIGLHLRTEDIARFGTLYLHKGWWNGRSLIPSAWVDLATARQMSNGSNPDSDFEQGYGFQFWRARHATYQGNGAFGQFCMVMPEQDAVVVMTSGTGDLQGELNLVWDKLLPAMKAGALPPNPDARGELERALAGLTLHPPKGDVSAPTAATVSGKTYAFPPNPQNIETVSLEFQEDDAILTIHSQGQDLRFDGGHGVWKEGTTTFVAGVDPWLDAAVPQRVAASGAWTAPDVYTMKLALYETPLAVTLSFRFAGERLMVLKVDYNVEFGAIHSNVLMGDVQ